MLPGLLKRLGQVLYQILISIDQLSLLLVQLVTYGIFGRGDEPNADETVSSKVGRNALAGKKWALIAEKVINALFWFDPDHCRGCVGS